MKIVITGATGFLGRPLCVDLAKLGHIITAVSRNADRARSLLDPSVQCLNWDGEPGQAAPWEEAVAAADAIVHLAGQAVAEKAWTPEIKEALRRSRIDTTRRLVDVMRSSDRRPQVLVCASGINYYGDRGEENLTEASPPGDTFLAELCIAWEAEACKASAMMAYTITERVRLLNSILHTLPDGQFRKLNV